MFILSTIPIGLRAYAVRKYYPGTLRTKETKDRKNVVCDYYTMFSSNGQQLPLICRVVFDKKTSKPVRSYFVSLTTKGKVEVRDTDDVLEYGFPAKITLSGHKEICQQHGFPQQIKVKGDLDFDSGKFINLKRFNLAEPTGWKGKGKWVPVESDQSDPRNEHELSQLIIHCKAYIDAATDVIGKREGEKFAHSIISPPN